MGFDVLSIVQMIGGLALFIYGMTTMGKGLERAAGSKLEKTLEKMTGNVVTALLMGMVVTMVIQSSSATTVMVVGFVNAGIMTLKQSVGVISVPTSVPRLPRRSCVCPAARVAATCSWICSSRRIWRISSCWSA